MAPPGGGGSGGSGGGGTAAAEAQAQATQKLAEAQRNLEAVNKDVHRQLEQSAAGFISLTNATNETNRALQDVYEAKKRLALVTGQNIDKVAEYNEGIRQTAEALRDVGDIASNMTARVRGMWGITSQWSTDLASNLVAARVKGEKLSDVFKNISDESQTLAAKQQVAGSMMLKVSESLSAGWAAILHQSMSLVNSIDQQTAAFKTATGASERYVNTIPALEAKFFNLGLSMEDAASLMGSLYSSMTGFTRLGPDAQRTIRETTAVLSTLGIDAETTAQNMEILTRSMGMTGQQAAAVNRKLFILAQQLDISTTKMMEDFTRLGPQLVVHGNRAVSVYTRLQAAAKSSGIEISRILDMSAKFDRFDTAAESVGHLNAVLGGPYLSVMKMVQTTDPTERMRMLSAATRQAGLSFDTLAYYQRKALAEAAGLQDVNELALIMRNRFDLVGESTQKSAYELEKLAEQNREYKTIQDELKQAMRALAVPVTKVLYGLKSLLEVFQTSPTAVNVLIGTVVFLKSAMVGLQVATTAATLGVSSFAAAATIGVLGAGVFAAAIGFIAYTMMQEGHSPPLFAKGGGMTMAAQQTYSLASAFSSAGTQAKLAGPEMRRLALDLNSLPDSKMIHIKKVFDAEAGVAEAAKGANITRQTIALLGAATAGAAGGGGRPIQNHIDLTVDLDGRTVAHQTAKRLQGAA